ncbi:MAG: DUF2950 domain-containing protein [Gammaproteobacteria bacterium]|nr:DUF2950 domain-containing protein [Gammaproteobacteria bacterium]
MNRFRIPCVLTATLAVLASAAMAAEPAAPPAKPKTPAAPAAQLTYPSAQKAAEAMVDAAERFDVTSLVRILGPQGEDLVLTGEYAQDRERSQEFAAQARQKMQVTVDPKSDSRAYLLVGEDNWPFAIPMVKRNGRWSFDVAAGQQELMFRRIGSNELDAIDICEGYVDAQFDYAYRKRQGYAAPQYAQQIISSPGKQDGLAWQNPDGTWGGPIGEKIAQAIAQGYDVKADPYHGYFFKVLKSQGPAAPLGAMDYVIGGVMIGGFALVAAPAEYGETGLKTFMVSHTGVVYEKDLGPATLEEFQKMERFNPDKTWTPVADQ